MARPRGGRPFPAVERSRCRDSFGVVEKVVDQARPGRRNQHAACAGAGGCQHHTVGAARRAVQYTDIFEAWLHAVAGINSRIPTRLQARKKSQSSAAVRTFFRLNPQPKIVVFVVFHLD